MMVWQAIAVMTCGPALAQAQSPANPLDALRLPLPAGGTCTEQRVVGRGHVSGTATTWSKDGAHYDARRIRVTRDSSGALLVYDEYAAVGEGSADATVTAVLAGPLEGGMLRGIRMRATPADSAMARRWRLEHDSVGASLGPVGVGPDSARIAALSRVAGDRWRILDSAETAAVRRLAGMVVAACAQGSAERPRGAPAP